MRWIFSGAAALVFCLILLSGCAAEDVAMPETNDVQTSRREEWNASLSETEDFSYEYITEESMPKGMAIKSMVSFIFLRMPGSRCLRLSFLMDLAETIRLERNMPKPWLRKAMLCNALTSAAAARKA